MEGLYDNFVEYTRPEDMLQIIEQSKSEQSFERLRDLNSNDLTIEQRKSFNKAISIVVNRLTASMEFPKKSHDRKDFLAEYIDDFDDEVQLDAALAASRVIEAIADKVVRLQ